MHFSLPLTYKSQKETKKIKIGGIHSSSKSVVFHGYSMTQ